MLYVKKSDLKAQLQRYRRNWPLFLLSLLACLAVASLFIFVKNKRFEVYTSIKITDGSTGGGMMAAMAKNSGFGDILGMGGTEVDNEMVILESHHVIYNAVKQCGYNVSYSSRPFIKRINYWQDSPIAIQAVSPTYSDTLQESLKWKVTLHADGKTADIRCKTYNHGKAFDQKGISLPAQISTTWGDFTISATGIGEQGKEVTVKAEWYSYTAVAQSLMRDMSIKLIDKKADIIQISYKDAIPDRCKALLNAIVESYEQYSLEAKNRAAMLSMDFMQQRLDTISQELAEIESEVEAYKLNHKLSIVDKQAEIALEASKQFDAQLTELELFVTNLKDLEQYLNDPLHEFDPLPIVSTGSNDATQAIMDYNSGLAHFLELKRATTPNNPTFISAQKAIESSKEALKLTIRSAKENAMKGYSKFQAKNNQLMGMTNSLPTLEREYINLVRQQELKQKIYVMLMAQQEQNALNLSMDQPKSERVDEAYANVLPSGPKAIVILIIALFFALFLPIAWFRLLDMINPKLISPTQLQNLEGFLGDIHLISPDNQEDLRQLALELAHRSRDKQAQALIVTMQGGEESGTLAESLRTALAAMGTTASQVSISEAPAFTASSEVMYRLVEDVIPIIVVRQNVTLRENLTYIETLLDKQLLGPGTLTAYMM